MSMVKYPRLREEEVKNRVAADFFGKFDCGRIIGNIDFCVSTNIQKKGQGILFTEGETVHSLLWAEAKKGTVPDINESFVQLILTIGKAKTFNDYIPPQFLVVFDAEKIAFIPYHLVADVFNQNDFNWNVTSSNHATKEFVQVYETVEQILNENKLVFTIKIC